MANCRNCDQPVRRPEPGDGIDPRDYEWVHDDGNPICPLTLTAEPDEEENHGH